MRDTLRSIAILLAVLGAVAGPGFAAPAKAAGERDVTVAQCIDAATSSCSSCRTWSSPTSW
jgi:hypothetical protein